MHKFPQYLTDAIQSGGFSRTERANSAFTEHEDGSKQTVRLQRSAMTIDNLQLLLPIAKYREFLAWWKGPIERGAWFDYSPIGVDAEAIGRIVGDIDNVQFFDPETQFVRVVIQIQWRKKVYKPVFNSSTPDEIIILPNHAGGVIYRFGSTVNTTSPGRSGITLKYGLRGDHERFTLNEDTGVLSAKTQAEIATISSNQRGAFRLNEERKLIIESIASDDIVTRKAVTVKVGGDRIENALTLRNNVTLNPIVNSGPLSHNNELWYYPNAPAYPTEDNAYFGLRWRQEEMSTASHLLMRMTLEASHLPQGMGTNFVATQIDLEEGTRTTTTVDPNYDWSTVVSALGNDAGALQALGATLGRGAYLTQAFGTFSPVRRHTFAGVDYDLESMYIRRDLTLFCITWGNAGQDAPPLDTSIYRLQIRGQVGGVLTTVSFDLTTTNGVAQTAGYVKGWCKWNVNSQDTANLRLIMAAGNTFEYRITRADGNNPSTTTTTTDPRYNIVNLGVIAPAATANNDIYIDGQGVSLSILPNTPLQAKTKFELAMALDLTNGDSPDDTEDMAYKFLQPLRATRLTSFGLAKIGSDYYGVDSSRDYLLKWNSTTDAWDRVGTATNFGISGANIQGLAAIGNTLYTVLSYSVMVNNVPTVNVNLCTLSTSTGVATRVGSSHRFGINEQLVSGLAAIGNTLYAIGSTNDYLFTISTTSGAATRVGTSSQFGLGESVPRGFAAAGGKLYAIGDSNKYLFEINTTTGIGTRIGDITNFGYTGESYGLSALDDRLFTRRIEVSEIEINRTTGEGSVVPTTRQLRIRTSLNTTEVVRNLPKNMNTNRPLTILVGGYRTGTNTENVHNWDGKVSNVYMKVSNGAMPQSLADYISPTATITDADVQYPKS